MPLDFPASPSTGQTFTGPNGVIWQYDGAKWVAGTAAGAYAPVASPAFTGNPTAPTPPAGDADTSVATTAFVAASTAGALANVGRNLIHNSMFNISQRTGPWTLTNSYTADRWVMSFVGGSLSMSVGTINDANRAQIGDEAAAFHLVANAVGGAGTNDETYFEQRIEGLRRTAGKTVILSFWAAATAGTPKLSVPMIQIFGTGGSAAYVAVPVPQIITLSTTYTRYTLTYAVPTIAGKTLGTAGTDYLSVRFGLSAGASQAGLYGALGQQSYVLALWGVQLEVGSTATPLEKLDPVTQLQQCQRFFYVGGFSTGGYAPVNGSGFHTSLALPVTMRAVQITIVPTFTTQTNCGSSNISVVSATTLSAATFSTAGSVNITFAGTFTASADL